MNIPLINSTDSWQAMYEALAAYARRYGHCYVDAAQEDLFDWCRRQRNHRRLLNQHQHAALEALGFDWQVTGGFHHQRWEETYEQLKAYQQRYGHCRVSAPEDAALAKWVSRQRSQENTLPTYRKEKLNALGFDWYADMRQLEAEQYEARFAELTAFSQEHGHFRVPKVNSFLHLWVIRQRRDWAQLSPDWQKRFLAIGFEPKPLAPKAVLEKWQQMFTLLQRFVLIHGHARVPSHWQADPSLANWVTRQRNAPERLSLAQKKQLDALGFAWKADIKRAKRARWEQRYRELEAFQREHGHCRIPDQYKANPSLGSWVSIQRENQDKLSADKRTRLDALGFAWRADIKEQAQKQWYRMLGKLKAFQKQHGHCRVPEGWEGSPKLAIWVGMHRQYAYRLPSWKRAKLDAIGFTWSEQLKNERRQGWEQRFEQLVQFKSQHGHCRVTLKNTPHYKLFSWVTKQRRFPQRLTAEQRFRLNELGFQWIQSRSQVGQQKWDIHYRALVAFQQQHGHCRVPEGWVENPRLAGWVASQRRLESKLSDERKRRLEALHFTWQAEIQESKDADWQATYEKLCIFKAAHGHCRVPANWKEDPHLGHWVFRQRSRGDILPLERRQQLDALEFEWQVSKGVVSKKK